MIDTTGKTLQQVSDEIAAVLIKQGEQCLDINNPEACAYEDNNGLHCAVGHLLPSGVPDLIGNSTTIDAVLQVDAVIMCRNYKFISDNIEALTSIQRIHDGGTYGMRVHARSQLRMNHKLDTKAWDAWVKMGE